MKQLLKYNPNFIKLGLYTLIMILMCVWVALFIFSIQSQYAGDFINLRFNVYEGIREINSAQYVWQYLIYSILFSILNGLGIWYIQKRFINPHIQNTLIYWIFGSSVLTLSLIAYYLALVLDMNNISS